MKVDLLFLAFNRLEFTRESWKTLVVNTNWARVNRLYVIDDGSTDGTAEFLQTAAYDREIGAVRELLEFRTGSPILAMIEFWKRARADLCAVTSNDVMLPPSWLDEVIKPFEKHPNLDALGIEALQPPVATVAEARSYRHAHIISSLGLQRRSAFERFGLPQALKKYFGFDRWVSAHGTKIVRGWMEPAIPMFLLDRIPFAPWRQHSDRYTREGWQRRWPPYEKKDAHLWSWWQQP